MKDNYLTLKDKRGNKKEYRILLDIKDTNKDVNYVIYTDDKKDKDGVLKAYASSYVLSKKGNMTQLKKVCDKEEIDMLSSILDSLS